MPDLVTLLYAAGTLILGYVAARRGVKLPSLPALPVTPVPPRPDAPPAPPLSPAPAPAPGGVLPELLALLATLSPAIQAVLLDLLRRRQEADARQQIQTLLSEPK